MSVRPHIEGEAKEGRKGVLAGDACVPVPGGEIKRDPEIGKTAIQPEPAQTADLSISGSRLISSLCIDCPTLKNCRLVDYPVRQSFDVFF